MPDELSTVLAAVGPRLRTLRRQRSVTLEQLAESTGISVSTLELLNIFGPQGERVHLRARGIAAKGSGH